jgi:hypothetical protein
MHKMALADDKFRLTALAAYADINVDFFGIGPSAGERGRSIELNEKGLAVMSRARRACSTTSTSAPACSTSTSAPA